MIEIKNVSKTFKVDGKDFEALKNVSLKINDGDIYGIIGMSGAGKSTLVRCINMLESPTSGDIVIDGKSMTALSPSELRKERSKIAMIFQSFNLLMQKNVLKNISFPLELAGVKRADARKKALELLELVGLPDKANAYPAQLSGGQQQRVAIARALATDPKILLCDEATSALDPKTTKSILNLIKEINQKYNITVVIITHAMSVVEEVCNKVAIISDGVVAEEGEVVQVFAHPQSEVAKHLVNPDYEENQVNLSAYKKVIRIVLNGANIVGMPLISKLSLDLNILVNLVSVSTKELNGVLYGNITIGVDSDETLLKIRKYLAEFDGIEVEEVR
ncbi:MAG: ATP-binding cassette domain-containing protein [Ruminococcus bromii]|uniref:methionine ABC transporter ATP-binding protein n=1 Tax=Ruminococcus sp. YE282 TaxID=3158780 RepID=UPI000889E51F|nr:ATP-binding cassette domain-containing protein [Ruminococcus bromii]HCB96406.1 ABC transporter [Ruminococcus sp.]MCI7211420.1 ATP-binding cassette domain-containing protein [Ruminococcus bromii]MDD6434506.1 ATP-binding cassette domain-containing protein [Ruminococcus bromii]MDY4083942.1 ATP-binding cassette domain-containing protein [Ruminococcus bromii]